MPRLFFRISATFAVVCSSHMTHANGFHLDTNTSGVGRSDESAVRRVGSRIEMIPQEHFASRREIFSEIHCAISLGAVSTLSCAANSPCFAEAGLESDIRQHNGMNPTNIASTTPGNESSTSAVECDEECKEQRRRRIEERRAMMRQSRSTSSRQEVFELSKQRARLYGSDYKGANCVDGVPCI